MKRMRLSAALCVALATVALAGCNDGMLPPGGAYATVSGVVLDHATNQPISGATIIVDSVLRAQTGPDGTFSLTVPSGDVDYVVEATGYKPTDPPLHVNAQAGKIAKVTVTLIR